MFFLAEEFKKKKKTNRAQYFIFGMLVGLFWLSSLAHTLYKQEAAVYRMH
jgi:hypothetical protein